MIHVIGPLGEVIELPAEEAEDAALRGWEPATPEAIESFQRKKLSEARYGTAGQQALAGVEGAGRGLTFGLSTGLERALGANPADIRGREAENPWAAGIGTAIGIAAPLVATGGGSGLAEGALGAGEVAGRAAPAAAAGVGKSLLGGLAVRAAAAGAEGAAYGAAYGAGQVVHESMLGSPRQAADALLSGEAWKEVGISALLGGGLGAGVGLLGGGVFAAVQAARATLAGAGDSAANVLGRFYRSGAGELVTGVPGDVADLMLANRQQIVRLNQQIPRIGEIIEGATPDMARFILANDQRFLDVERAYPGTVSRLARVDVSTAEKYLDDWPRIVTDKGAFNKLSEDVGIKLGKGHVAVEDALHKLHRDARPEVIARGAESVDPAVASSEYRRIHEIIDRTAREMRRSPELYPSGFPTQLERIRNALGRDAPDEVTTLGSVARAAVEDERVGLALESVPLGSGETRIVTPRAPTGERAHYAVIEADDLVASHGAESFAPNPKYPAEVQERDYLRGEGEQLKTIKGGKNLRPEELLNETQSATSGPPLVTSGAPVVVGGNGRTMMIRRAYGLGEPGARYRTALLDRASLFGLDREAVEKLRQPVLVRVLADLSDKAPRAELAAAVRRLNEDMTQKLSARLSGVAEARALSRESIASIGEILGGAGDDSLRDLMRKQPADFIGLLERDGIVNTTNRAQWVSGAQLTDHAKDALGGMFLGRVVGTADRLAATGESLARRLERAAPWLVRVQAAAPEFDAIPAVRGAVDLLNEAERRQLTLAQVLGQESLFEAPATAEAARMAALLDGAPARSVGQRFREWALHAGNDTRQGTMFAASAPATRESADAILFSGAKEARAGERAGPRWMVADPVDGAVAQRVPLSALEKRGVASVATADGRFERVQAAFDQHKDLPPLRVFVHENGRWELEDGNRRLLAAQRAGMDSVPVVFRDGKGAIRPGDFADWIAKGAPETGAVAAVSEAASQRIAPRRVMTTRDLFVRLDRIRKTDLLPLERFDRNISPESANAVREVRALRATIKNSLEDPAKWGPVLAGHQARINAAQARYYAAEKALLGRKGVTGLMRKGSGISSTGRPRIEVNQAGIRTGLKGILDPAGREGFAALGEFNAASHALLDEIETSYSTALRSDFDATARRAVEETEAAGANAVRRAQATGEWQRLDSRARQTLFAGPDALPGAAQAIGIGSQAARMAAMGLVGGRVGSAVGIVAGAARGALRVTRTIATLAALERANQAVASHIGSAVSGLVRGGEKAASIGRAEVVAGVSRSRARSPEEARASYAKRVTEIQRLAQDPEQMRDALTAQIAELHEHAPDSAQALAVSSARAVAFLSSKIPRPPANGPLGAKWEPDRAGVARFNRYMEAVEHPLDMLKQTATGTLTQEALEAVRAVYPDIYSQMQNKLVDVLATQPRPPYRSRLMIGRLLGADLDGSLRSTRRNQQVSTLTPRSLAAGAPRARPAAAGKITLSDRLLTPQQRSAARQ